MTKMHFHVTFLSDIVLPATSNNEGRITQLDFIPGSNFLGMVASKAYNDFEDPFTVFHSGKVRFGDAHILAGDKPTYKIPFSFFHEKLNKERLFNHHLIKDFSKFKQLKQKRDGYMTEDLTEVTIDYCYLQKSAYDSKKRRSKESAMYGYEAIKAGTSWQFGVTCDNVSETDKEKIKENLTGEKWLGKSKSSQYGKIQIDFIDEIPVSKQTDTIAGEKVYLYAKSRLALLDESANPTYDVKHILPGLSSQNVSYPDTQIRISSYTPYNTAMRTKCYERIVIEKGSVIVLQNITEEQLYEITKGVGAYQSEGFGEILVNPSFLLKEDGFTLKKIDKKRQYDKESETKSHSSDDPLIQFLMYRDSRKKAQLALVRSVEEFIEENKKYFPESMNSQWGAIRALCNRHNDQTIADAVKEFISKGVAKEKWDGKKREVLLKAIENTPDKVAFVKLLAIQMPKENEKGAAA